MIYRTTIAAAAFALMAGCAAPLSLSPAIEFNYKTDNGKATGIVQVFDMGGNTVVQIKGLYARQASFLDAADQPIGHQVVGETAVLNGMHRSFSVTLDGRRSTVSRIDDTRALAVAQPPAPAAAPQEAAPPLADEALVTQLAALKRELAVLRTQLAVQEPPPVPRPYAAVASETRSTALRVSFKDNSDAFEPPLATARLLLELARPARQIAITGFTDSDKANPASASLARRRALAAKRYLVSRGIAAERITVAAQPAGGFVADNSTRAGRDSNRRVEVELI